MKAKSFNSNIKMDKTVAPSIHEETTVEIYGINQELNRF